MPFKRTLLLVGPSWCRGCLFPDGVIVAASSGLLLPKPLQRLVLGRNGERSGRIESSNGD